MSEKELRALLQKEYERCIQALAKVEVGSEPYRWALEAVNTLRWLKEPPVSELDGVRAAIIPADTAPAVVITPAEEKPAEYKPAEAPTEDGTDWGEYRLALRADLAGARQQGVNTTELLQAVGAGKYSEVPDHKLPDLRAELEKALANKENG